MRTVTLAIGSLLLKKPLLVLLERRNDGLRNVAEVGVEVVIIGVDTAAVIVDAIDNDVDADDDKNPGICDDAGKHRDRGFEPVVASFI